MILAYLLLLTGLTISAVAIYYSVVGLTAIFSAAVIPIIVMGASLEVAKLVCASWLKANWERAPRFIKYYMTIAVIVLMLITSMGIFGFLSKAHNDQNLVSGDVQSKIAIFDEKIKTAKENIEADRKQLKQMDEAVDQIMARSTSEGSADKANAVRKSQQRDRTTLAKDIESQQKLIASLNDEAAPIRAEVRKVDAEVGPIKYIAAFIYGVTPDASMLEKAVTWIIILIVVVFDPLAVIMLLGAQMTFAWHRKGQDPLAEETPDPYVADVGEKPTAEEKLPVTESSNDTKFKEDDNTLTDEQIDEINSMLAENAVHIEPEIETHTEEVPSETPLTALGGDITATESQEQNVESELEKWNKMIEEAEKEVLAQQQAEQSTVEERVAKGETYIDNEGKEVALEVDLPATEESKKKTYMTKDPSGTIKVISL